MPENQRDIREKWERFRESVMRQASAQVQKLDEELESYRSAQLDRYEKDIQEGSERFIKEEKDRVRSSADREVSERRAQLRRSLYQRREELTGELFAKAKARLAVFAEGPDYPEYLCEKAKKAAQMRRAEPVLLRVRSADLAFADRLMEACGQPCRVEADPVIELGGLRFTLESSGLEADETLDAGLEVQRQWFFENAGLFLTQAQGGRTD